MKHGSLISPDEAAFGLGTSKAVFEATSATHGDGGDCITVPDAHLLFSGEFKHVGNDLKIVGDDGKSFVVTDYFKSDKHPTLRSPEGATLTGDLVDLLAGPLAPGQYAQAGAPQPGAAEAVGRVAVVTGNVTVIRNGVAITVNAGDAILKNDVVQTGAGATCGVAFNDGSTFNIAAGARLAINEFVYDPNGSANASLVTLIQGAATFVAGQIAKTGDMKVATPVATMGIRGTAVILDTNALDGRVTISVIDQRDNKDHSVEVYDRAGNLIATATSFGGRLVLTPTATLDVIASFTNKTVEQIALEFAAFQAVLSSYDAAKQFFPNLPDHTDASPKNIQHADGTQLQPSEGGSKTLPDSPTFGDKVVVTEVVITKTTDSSTTGDDKDIDTDNHTVDPPPPPPPPFTVIVGTPGDDILTGTAGPDRIFAGPGNDTIVAGHGGGDDDYDGGIDCDTIKFPSADALQPLVFHLRGFAAQNTVDGPLTGHDVFTNIERIESGDGDDIFYIYDVTNWHLDAGDGIDIIRLVGDLDINGDTDGPDAKNFEIIDLRNGGQNTIGFEGGGLDESDNSTIRILGSGDEEDVVNLVGHFDEYSDGYWVLVSESPVLDPFGDDYSNDIYFYQYQFVGGPEVLTVYVDEDITVATLIEDGAKGQGTSSSAAQLAPEAEVITYDLTGWVPTPFTANGHYYAFVAASGLSWSGAQDAAEDMGGYLANITSVSENSFIAGVIAGHVQNGSTAAYIGGARFAEPEHWEWTNGAENGQTFYSTEPVSGFYTNWRSGEPNNYGDNESILVMEGDGTWNDAPADYSLSVGYVVEFDSVPASNYYEIFTQFSLGGTYGYLTLDIKTNLLTYHLDNEDADTQALTEGQIVTESFDVVVLDDDEPVTHTVEFKIAGANDAPVIDTDALYTESVVDGGPYDTTVLGLSVTDVDAGVDEIFHVTATAGHGTLTLVNDGVVDGSDDLETVSFDGLLDDINDILASGVIYSPFEGEIYPANDQVTLTVTDQNGATDTVNFIFNATGEPGVALDGTLGKDIIFSTGEDDTLAGKGGTDTFVFSFNEQQIGTDTIIDFHAGLDDNMDKILFEGAPESFASFDDLQLSQDGADTVISLGDDGSIRLSGVDYQQLQAANFIFHPIT